MNADEARRLAKKHIDDSSKSASWVVCSEPLVEHNFGFYFYVYPDIHYVLDEQGLIDEKDMIVGGDLDFEVIVERATGEVHAFRNEGRGIDYCFEACQRGLDKPVTVVVTEVLYRRRAAEALLRLNMGYVIPEEAYGKNWKIRQYYTRKDFLKSFNNLPARFENQVVFDYLSEIVEMESEIDIVIRIEPYKSIQ